MASPTPLLIPPPRGYNLPSGGRYLRKPRLVHIPPERLGMKTLGSLHRLQKLIDGMTKRHKCYLYSAGPEFVIISPFEIDRDGLVGVYTKAPGVPVLREELGR